MIRALTLSLLAAGALTTVSAANAATRTMTKQTTTTHATPSHKVTTKTSTGKTVTYDCSKAGNATKAACKK